MVGWRDIKRQARRDRHEHMSVPALYVARTGETPVRVDVRVHARSGQASVSGVGEGFAGFVDTTPRLVMDTNQVPRPLNNALVAVGPSEAYRIAHARGPDDQEITVEVTILDAAAAAAAWRPEWADLLP